MRTRGRERRTREAQELRTPGGGTVHGRRVAQREAAAPAGRCRPGAREQAEIAEARAAEAERGLAQTDAQREDASARPTGSTPRSTTAARTTQPGDVSARRA